MKNSNPIRAMYESINTDHDASNLTRLMNQLVGLYPTHISYLSEMGILLLNKIIIATYLVGLRSKTTNSRNYLLYFVIC
jgi:hypothetical protein